MIQNIFKTGISFLPRIDCDDTDIETISLGCVLVSNKWREKVEALRNEKDPEKRKALKKQLPCFTPSGIFTHVSREGLTKHSGFICLDIDYKPDKGINPNLSSIDLKQKISAVPQVAYCGRSCGGAGYFVLIPIADTTKHREYFRALEYHFKRCGITIDPQCKDISRKRFVSWDDSPYINTAAQPWGLTLPAQDHATRETMGRDLNEGETAEKVEALIKACEANKYDITEDYDNWLQILSALASTFGENGREYAHRISTINPGYTYEETEAKYNNLLKHPEYKYNIGTFFYIAREQMGKYDFDEICINEQPQEDKPFNFPKPI